MVIQIRKATVADAAGAIDTLRRSITELCAADHQNDMQEIEAWLANKSVDTWSDWIARGDAFVLVADRDQVVVGVGMATLRGEVLLNYVHPGTRFSGISKAMLAEIEKELRWNNIHLCQLGLAQAKARKNIMDVLDTEAQLRSKKELIERFISQHFPDIPASADVGEEFDSYWQA